MKIIQAFLLMISSPLFAQDDNKATIFRSDSIISMHAIIRLDHRIFGYEKPDVHSKKLLMLSVFTNDVEGNPHNCLYGAFYDTSSMAMDIKYIAHEGDFVKAELIKGDAHIATVYFEKFWVEWEKE